MALSLDELREGKVWPVNKPLDWTSFDVVNKIRHSIRKTHGLKKFKVGHAGTLDPKATGLLLICAGRATKQIAGLTGTDKRYRATIQLGATTPSYDTETEVDAVFESAHITEDLLRKSLRQFAGDILQFPPLHSAVKKDGKRLYESARRGIDVDVEARPVTVHSIEMVRFDLPEVELDIHCGKGTYIRSIAQDLGKALNSGAYLKALTRTAVGDFQLNQAFEVGEVCALISPDYKM